MKHRNIHRASYVDAHRAIKGFFLIRLLSVNIGIPKQTTQ